MMVTHGLLRKVHVEAGAIVSERGFYLVPIYTALIKQGWRISRTYKISIRIGPTGDVHRMIKIRSSRDFWWTFCDVGVVYERINV